MKAAAMLILALALAGCANSDGGDASYDALSRLRKSCIDSGGELKLREPGNPERLADYGCVRK